MIVLKAKNYKIYYLPEVFFIACALAGLAFVVLSCLNSEIKGLYLAIFFIVLAIYFLNQSKIQKSTKWLVLNNSIEISWKNLFRLNYLNIKLSDVDSMRITPFSFNLEFNFSNGRRITLPLTLELIEGNLSLGSYKVKSPLHIQGFQLVEHLSRKHNIPLTTPLQ